MDINIWKKLMITCSNYNDIVEFIILNTKKIKEAKILSCDYQSFILKPNVSFTKHIIKTVKPIKSNQEFDDIIGDNLYIKKNRRQITPTNKYNIIQGTQSEQIEFSNFVKTIFNINTGFTFDMNIVLSNNSYRKYFIKEYLSLFISHPELKLSDFDLKLFQINKDNQTLTINNATVKINYISSIEIKEYCLKQIYSDDKDICKNIIDTIYVFNEHNNICFGIFKSKIYEPYSIKIDLNMFNILKSPHSKFMIIKYIFSKFNNLNELKDVKEIFKIFETDSQSKEILLDLIRQMITTNNEKLLDYILKNKPIKIEKCEYKKLQDYSTSLNLFELTKILFTYESIDNLPF